MFCLRNLKVSTLRFLKNCVSKVAHFEIVQKNCVLFWEIVRLRDYGVFYLVLLKISALRNLQNSVGKGCW